MRTARKRPRRRLVAALLVGLVLLAACSSGGSDDSTKDSPHGSRGSLIVGSKDFAGARIISQAYGQVLAADGYRVTYKENIGPTETVYPLLENGTIDLYGEFSGTFLAYLGGQPTPDRADTFAAVTAALADQDVVAVGPALALDVNSFYVTEATAEKYDLKTVSDLKPVADELVFGGPPECVERPLCLGNKSQLLYGLDFQDVKKLDPNDPGSSSQLEDGTIDVAVLFAGNSIIKPDFVLLKDDKLLQPADNPIALVRKEKNTPGLDDTLEKVNAKLDSKAYREMVRRVLQDGDDPADVVRDWLEDVGLA